MTLFCPLTICLSRISVFLLGKRVIKATSTDSVLTAWWPWLLTIALSCRGSKTWINDSPRKEAGFGPRSAGAYFQLSFF